MKKMRIISLLAVIVLLISSLGMGVYASADETKNELSATVESTILVAGDDPVNLTISSGKIVSVTSSDDDVATFDPKTNKVKPVGEGEATLTITNDAGEVTTVDVKVYASSLSLGIETALLGMGIVFSVLILIWIILAIFGKIATAGNKPKKEKPAPAPKAAPAPAPAPAAPVAVAPASAASDDSELVAAITAAVSLCMDMPVGSFRVVSFRKTNTKQAWNKK